MLRTWKGPEHTLEDVGREERESFLVEAKKGKRRVEGVSGKPIRKPFLGPWELMLVVGVILLLGVMLFTVWYWPMPDFPFLKK